LDEPDTPLECVRDAFALSLFHSSASLQRESSALLRGERDASRRLASIAHRLVGTAASLGFDEVALQSRALESALQERDERWHARLFSALRALDESSRPLRAVPLALQREGAARALFALFFDAREDRAALAALAQPLRALAELPTTPRGALFVDGRRELMSRVREARAAWAERPLVAIVPDASEAQTLLALRAGADFVHRDAIDPDALAISAWSTLEPPLNRGALLWLDHDPLRSASLRAALEPLGARVSIVPELSSLQSLLRTALPHVAVLDFAHPDALKVESVLEQQAPTVPLRSLGEAPARSSVTASIEARGSFAQLVIRVGRVLLDALGQDDLGAVEQPLAGQTLEIDRAELAAWMAKKGLASP
jgi:HPt (histidine-containing phosphotransfer) domain-containing protein/CheY-like chemotaxis protein